VPGLQVVSNKGEWPRGNEPLDAPILSQSTNQARRGSRKRPEPPGGTAAGPGTTLQRVMPERVYTLLIAD